MTQFCKECGSALQPGEVFCKTCYSHERDEYRIVKEYLRTHPNSNAMQIANETGISISKIMKYIRNGSLTVVTNDGQRRSR
ncbi:hypothetical protein G3578_17015 [Brevibacillus sp. SYP-B805]|uniref:hypothetical protein n=1 Tax=Brevibacillus sp. SYP-B805 TaxID=1578199 RepID=UPI0013ED9F88|nr:hypothetical protein [Brevibacillus sp. SYP-B805]NGQ96868.1 hypothetical protein [Brevibacillus sp. SYP-B805]